MADTPNMLRGWLYPTHLASRCPTFKQCVVCKMCEHYSKFRVQCILCEQRKYPVQICTCTPKHREHFLLIQEKLKVSLSDPNGDQKGTYKAEVAHDPRWDEISHGLQQIYGRMSKISETTDTRGAT